MSEAQASAQESQESQPSKPQQPSPQASQPSARISLEQYRKLLVRYLRPFTLRALIMAVLLLLSIGLNLVIPQLLGRFIDAAGDNALSSQLARIAVAFLIVAVVQQIISAFATYMAADVGWRATNSIRQDLAAHCLGLDMGFHTNRTPGELIERIDGDVTALSTFFSQFTIQVLGGILMLGGILVLLWLEHPLVGLIITLFVLLALWLFNFMRELAVDATKDERAVSASHYAFIEERLAALEDLRANGAGGYSMRRFAIESNDYFYRSRRAWMTRLKIWLVSISMYGTLSAIGLALAIYFYRQGLTIGSAYMIFQYILMLETPIDHITQQMKELQKAAAGIGRMSDIFATQSIIETTNSSQTLPKGALSIDFEAVNFAYGEKKVLNNVSFRLEAGRVLGLLGRTGSGKSTLTRLLFRFYDPSSGTVRLAGRDLRQLDPQKIHEHVSMVTQDVQLFQGSLRQNLTFFDDSVPDSELWRVLEALSLRQWVEKLPQALDTPLAANGSSLSAGEGQLIALARVFLKNPDLIILDEPSSKLDPATEQLLENAMQGLLKNRTAIIIAHRLKTVERADDIMVLRDGELLEFAPRQQLAKDTTSHFYQLLQAGGDLDAPVKQEKRGEQHAFAS